jgi:CheY-like chemotaxis protein
MAHVLIIDDEDMVRLVLRLCLEEAGHTVSEAENGRQGVGLLRARSSDLVITDLIMPEKEGVETIAEIRRSHPHIPIIAISGGGRIGAKDFLNVAAAVGADRTLPKPFTPEEVMEVVEALLAA